MVSADRAEQRIVAARNKAIAEVKKSPVSADRAEQRIQSAVNKEIASIRGKAPPKPPPPPPPPPPRPVVKPTTPSQPQPPAAVVVPPPTTLPTPSAEPAIVSPPPPPPPVVVKSANLETILFNDEEFSSEFIVDLLFESVAGQELLTIARNDTVNGQDVIYQPIRNLNIIQDTYNPGKLLALYDTSDSFFGAFAIDLRSKIPSVGSGPSGKNYYLSDAGDLIIEVVNTANDEQIEFQVADSGTIEELGI